MKNLLLVIMLLVIWLVSSASFAQTGWTLQTNPLGSGEEAMLGKVQFVSPTEGWISCGNGGLLHTTNAGVVWNFINPFPNDTVGRMSDPAVSMSWVGTTHGWIIGGVGGENNPHGAVIFYTTNGGADWLKKVISNTPGEVGFQIQFADINTGWLLSYNFSTQAATFLKTTDGGNNWFPFTGAGIFYFVDADNGWAYSGSGISGAEPPFKIYRTVNGGTDWVEQFSDNTVGRYNGITFTDINNGWVVGNEGKVLKTTNGGSNWSFVTNSGINPLESCKTLFFLNGNTGWIPSKAQDPQHTPFLKYTTDGGLDWLTQTTPFGDPGGGNAIFSIFFINEQKGWITGDYGRIAVYNGVTSVEPGTDIVTDFSIEQNYPNPFNPTTKINYSIPSVTVRHAQSDTKVSLKVFDVIGNEVATLVDEYKQAGSYEVTFNAENLSSGIYYYRLICGSFSESRKMIYLK